MLTGRTRRTPSPSPTPEIAAETLSAGQSEPAEAQPLAVPVACGRCGGETYQPLDFNARGQTWSLCVPCAATRILAEFHGVPLALAVLTDATGVQLDAGQRTHVEYATALVSPGMQPVVPADRLTMIGQQPNDAAGPTRWWFLDMEPIRAAAAAFLRGHTPRRGPGTMPCVECGQTHAVAWHETTGGHRCDDCRHDDDMSRPAEGSMRDQSEIRADLVIGQILCRTPVALAARAQAGDYDGNQYVPMRRADKQDGYGPASDRRGRWEFITPDRRSRMARAHDTATRNADPTKVRTRAVTVGSYLDADGKPAWVETAADRVAEFDALAKRHRDADAKHLAKCETCRAEGKIIGLHQPPGPDAVRI